MENITSIAGLKNAIQLLEAEQAVKGQILKEQFHNTYERLKPASLLKGTLKDIVSSPNLIENILGTTIGLATGYLTKKIVIGASGNLFRKLFGSVMQIGVTNAVAHHPDTIKSLGQAIIQRISQKKDVNSRKSLIYSSKTEDFSL
jgi:hypothetical protein